MTSIEELYTIFEQHPVISTDSRKVIPGSLFFALKGTHFDGNRFASDALASSSFAVVDDPSVATDTRYIVVDNVLQTLQQLATYHRKKLDTTIIAITGTNGKTTTKELISRALAKEYQVIATEGNLNNHIGVPLTLLRMTNETDFGIIEMGASAMGEIAALCQIARPDCGIITNIGKAHLEGFGSFEGVKKAKAELYQYLYQNNGIAFVNADNPILEDMSPPKKSILYGTSKFTHCQGKLRKSGLFTEFNWISTDKMFYDEEPVWDDERYLIKTQLYGYYNFENLLAAVCIADYFGVNPTLIKQALESYVPLNSRSQILKTQKNTLIIDNYNANPSSMAIAIENFAQLNSLPKCFIGGDMLELGKFAKSEHEAILDMIETQHFGKVFLAGPVFQSFSQKYSFEFFENAQELGLYLSKNILEGYCILIKGSRGIALEGVVPYL